MGSTQSSKLPGGSTAKGSGASRTISPPSAPFNSTMASSPTPSTRPPQTPQPPSVGTILRNDLAGGGLKLTASVGPRALNRPKDVFQVERVLNQSGLLNRSPGMTFAADTAAAIGEGQNRLNLDHQTSIGIKPLKVDGLVNPDGPTQSAARKLAGRVAEQWRAQVASPTAKPHHSLPRSDIKTRKESLSSDQMGELSRLADGLSKTKDTGPIAGDVASAISSVGDSAIAEFLTLRDKLAKQGSPDQVRALDMAVMQKLPQDARNKLRKLMGNGQKSDSGNAGELASLALEMTPGIGNAISAVNAAKSGKETIEALSRGDFKDTARHAGSTLLEGIGVIPVAGSIVKGAVKGGKIVWKSKIGIEAAPTLKGKSAKLVNKHFERFPLEIHDAIKSLNLKDSVITGGKRNAVNIDSKGSLQDANQAFNAIVGKMRLDAKRIKALKDSSQVREIEFGDGLVMQVRPNSGSKSGNVPTIELKFGKKNSQNYSGKSSIKIRFKGEGS